MSVSRSARLQFTRPLGRVAPAVAQGELCRGKEIGRHHTFTHKPTRRWSDLSTAVGFAAALLGVWLLLYRDGFDSLGWAALAVGLALLFLGSLFYIYSKGYHPAWCLLFFPFWPMVLLVCFFLPDRKDHAAQSGASPNGR